ncbi:MAG TPA: TMEM165/GDT1 family protein [Verrucomicrobiae bacterium]|nr:TMEM165/GDT1 family protein [Verrucomicrobiae bacterium]
MHAATSFGSVVVLAFWAVLIAELVGDKSIYTLTSLSLRFRPVLVFAAFTVASGLKMLAAVLLGRVVMQFHSHWTYVISGVAFFISAVLIWWEEPPEAASSQAGKPWAQGALICFTSFFLTEWADPGQISAAALVVNSHMALATWMGGTLAILFKGGVAMTLGMQLRSRLPQWTLRTVASGSCCVLGILALGEGVLG